MEIRRPGPDVVDPLLAFFERIPAAERTFFKESVLDRATVESWTGGARGLACDLVLLAHPIADRGPRWRPPGSMTR